MNMGFKKFEDLRDKSNSKEFELAENFSGNVAHIRGAKARLNEKLNGKLGF